jgi:hypothetical protein
MGRANSAPARFGTPDKPENPAQISPPTASASHCLVPAADTQATLEAEPAAKTSTMRSSSPVRGQTVSCSTLQEIAGTPAQNPWNQHASMARELQQRTAHNERFYVIAALRSRTLLGS